MYFTRYAQIFLVDFVKTKLYTRSSVVAVYYNFMCDVIINQLYLVFEYFD